MLEISLPSSLHAAEDCSPPSRNTSKTWRERERETNPPKQLAQSHLNETRICRLQVEARLIRNNPLVSFPDSLPLSPRPETSLSLSTTDSVLCLGQTLTDFFNGAPFNDGNNQPPTTSPKDCHHNAFKISRLLFRPPLSCLLARWEVCKQETRANAQVCAGNCWHSAHCWHSFHQDLLVADATCNAGGASSLSQWASWNRIVLGGKQRHGEFQAEPLVGQWPNLIE